MSILESLASYWHFVSAGFTRHTLTGAVVPSQRFLIDRMIEPVPPDCSATVLELGAGNGALTLRLAARCRKAEILACEINPVLAGDLRRRLADAGFKNVEIVAGSAQELLAGFINKPADKPSYIISGIPLGNLDNRDTYMLIDSIAEALHDGGTYIQYQHSLIDRHKIQERLPVVETVPVWLNFPPAFIYYAYK